MDTLTFKAGTEERLIEIISGITDNIVKKRISSGMVYAYVSHTTVRITLSDSFDLNVVQDMLFGPNRLIPGQ